MAIGPNFTEDDERQLATYTKLRDALRNALAHGAYPNLVAAVAADEALAVALAGELADDDLLAYHDKLMGPIMPYVAQLRQAAEGMIAIMQAIEAASPGTFGIQTAEPGAQL